MKKLLLLTAILFCTVPVAAQEAELRDSLKEVLVTAVREKMRNTTQTGLMRFEGKQLRSGVAVFGTPDIIKKLQMLPGVAAGNELMSGLYVHGGDGTDNLFLLDGIPLYNISHFGGLFSSFNTDIVDNLDFYKSGFPARYGGRLSSVVDVETREGSFEKYHGSVSIGMIDGRLQFEGPIVKNKTSFNLALRRTWMDVVTLPAIAYANLKYGGDQVVGGGYAMWDANARLTHKFSEDNVLNACFYMGQDNLHFSLKQKEDGVDGNSLKMGVKWGSLTASVSHNYKYSNKLRSRHVLYYSRSNSDTGYDFLLGTAGSDGSATSMTDSDVSGVQELGARSDWDWFPNSWNHVRYGLSLQYHWYDSGRKFLTTMVSGGEELSRSEGDESLGYRAFEPAIYIEDEIFIRHNLSANLGLRYALFQTGRKVWHSPEPRVALKWMPHPIVSAKVSYTRMSQFAHLVSAMYIDLPSNCWMPSTEEVRPMMSDQVAGGIYLTPYKDVKLNVEGWYKTMDYILTYNGGNSFVPPITGWEKTFSEGRGRSWGMEVEATYDNGKLAFSTYYTLSWSQRRFDAVYSGWFPDRNDNRHKLNLVAQWRFARCWTVFADWNYHSGNRITLPSHVINEGHGTRFVYESPYNAQLPDYHRLDFGMDFEKTNRKNHTFKVNLSIYNLYNHLNPVFAILDRDDDGNYIGMAYGLVPIIPTVTFTFRF